MGKIAKLLLPFLLVVFAFGGGVFDEFDNINKFFVNVVPSVFGLLKRKSPNLMTIDLRNS